MKYIIIALIIALALFLYNRSSSNKKLALENNSVANDFLVENKSNEGVIETPTGLQYKVLSKGNGTQHPNKTSTVTVHYHGYLIDGTVFDSSVERNEPISFPLNRVISGWTEGLQLMLEGDKYRFFIPPHLAYGNQAAGKIPPGSLLIFEVELIGIQ